MRMKTFTQYLEGLFDTKVHQHPMASLAEDFIRGLPREFSVIPYDTLKLYVRYVLDDDEVNAGKYRASVILGAKSYGLVRKLDEMLSRKREEMKRDMAWYGDPTHGGRGFGQK